MASVISLVERECGRHSVPSAMLSGRRYAIRVNPRPKATMTPTVRRVVVDRVVGSSRHSWDNVTRNLNTYGGDLVWVDRIDNVIYRESAGGEFEAIG